MSRYIEFVQYLDVEKIRKEMSDRITNANEEYALYERVANVLKTMDGWTFTKRIATAVEKALPGYTANLERIASLVNLKVWPTPLYNRRISMSLGYETDGQLNYQHCAEKHWKCWTNLKVSTQKREKGLEKVPEFVARLNEYIKGLKELQKEAAQYDMDYDFDLLVREK